MKGGPLPKRFKGAKGKAIPAGASGDNIGKGEVRFDTAEAADLAVTQLNGSELQGAIINVECDLNSKDGTKLLVTGLPMGVEWQELKDHFSGIGDLAFADVKGGNRKGPKQIGEVRYDDPAATLEALEVLNGSLINGGGPIQIEIDVGSKDRSKLIVSNIPAGIAWQELKDHFAQIGHSVAFCNISSGAKGIAEVRYDDAAHTMAALQTLNGSSLMGCELKIELDPNSNDGSKLLVSGLNPLTQWQELKDHFGQIAPVAFVNIPKGKGKGKGKIADATAGKGPTNDMAAMMKMMAAMGGGGAPQNYGPTNDMASMMQMMTAMGGGGGVASSTANKPMHVQARIANQQKQQPARSTPVGKGGKAVGSEDEKMWDMCAMMGYQLMKQMGAEAMGQ